MPRYLITQSLLSSWLYVFNCHEGCEDDAMEAFLRQLRREPEEFDEEHKKNIQNGHDFEELVTSIANGADWKTDKEHKWYYGASQIAAFLKGAQFQVRAQREITVDGITFLVYGILDALCAGTISDIKFKNKSFGSLDLAGNYLDSPQHPLYFYLVPEARHFRYMVSDGSDIYIEQYEPEDCIAAGDLILQFVQFLKANSLLETYKEKWLAL